MRKPVRKCLAEAYGKLITRQLTIAHMYHPPTWERLLEEAGLELVEAHHFLPRDTTALFDRLLIVGNALQPASRLLRGTPFHNRYVDYLMTLLTPYIDSDAHTGGALLLVARKPC